MIVDVCKFCGTVRRVLLPGGSIFYGQQGAIQKTMAFVWAVWLLFGPDEYHLHAFVDRVVCWTTDFGVEVHSIETPDCITAFLAWIGGTALSAVAPRVRHGTRLFKRAMRIQGWSHCFGNMMRRVASSYQFWQEVLECLRHVCRFF